MKRITIVGGGLAGLTLGTILRRESVEVTVLEAGEYPRHRVCGEFISGRGISLLSRLGIYPALRKSGIERAETIQFFMGSACSPRMDLPEPAWCLSRWSLDAILAKAFQEAGGEIELRTRWVGVPSSEGWVYSWGRPRTSLKDERWVGVKFHLNSLPLNADLEMHLQSGAYVGLCRVEKRRVNVCALLPHADLPSDVNRDPVSALGHWFDASLMDRLQHLRMVPGSFRAVAGLGYGAVTRGDDRRLYLGDAQGMIPPITGNGMSMAFEGAELARGPLLAWSRGVLEWQGVCREVRLRQQLMFSKRLRVARWLQRFLVKDSLARARRWFLPRLPWLMPVAFRFTR